MKELNEITIKRAATGQSDAFKELYDCYAQFLWKVIFRTTAGDEEATKLILQNLFIIVYKKLKKFNYNSQLSTWLYSIAYHESIRYLKKQRKKKVQEVEFNEMMHGKNSFTQDKKILDSEQVTLILNTLSPEERFLLVSREVNGFSYEEISTIVKKKEGAVRTALHRIKSMIREEFKNE